MHSMRHGLLGVLVAALVACGGRPDAAGVQRGAVISDQNHSSGTPGFLFFPPMIQPQPAFVAGAFVRALRPVVTVEELSPGTRGVVATLTDQVREEWSADESRAPSFYLVTWDTRAASLDPALTYRIHVSVRGTELGFADVDVVAAGTQLKNVQTSDVILLQDGRTLPIKFRIEEAAMRCVGVTCAAADGCHLPGTCDPLSGACSSPPKPSGSPCDDGDACTRTDVCEAGVCVGTSPVVCEAKDACHEAGTCDPATGACSDPPSPDGKTCDDRDLCTQVDTCRAGVCVGGDPVACTAGDQCHEPGSCNPWTGFCSDPASDDGKRCDDGDACTRVDACRSGACVGAAPVVCAASDQCHVAGTCDPRSGTCSDPPKPPGSPCDDGNACTRVDVCDAGACVGTSPVVCAAKDQCHEPGTCDPAVGVCSDPPSPDGKACNDRDLCTLVDTCRAGACVGAEPMACTAADQCHEIGRCDPWTGFCSNPASDDGKRCDDGDACTRTDVCRSGACRGADAVVCLAADDCHDAGTCDPRTGACSSPPRPPGTPCDDGDPCTTGDSCSGEAGCAGTAVTCTALDACHDAGTCDRATGACTTPAKANGASCSDQDACTLGDVCLDGVCRPGPDPLVCVAPECYELVECAPASGCVFQEKRAGAPCSSGGRPGVCVTGLGCRPPDGGGGPPTPRRCGRGTGDPHLEAWDGTTYDMQGTGAYVLAEDGPYVVYALLAKAANGTSYVKSIATTLGASRLTFAGARPDPLWVDGLPADIPTDGLLLGGGRVDDLGDGAYQVTWPHEDGTLDEDSFAVSVQLNPDVTGAPLTVAVCRGNRPGANPGGLISGPGGGDGTQCGTGATYAWADFWSWVQSWAVGPVGWPFDEPYVPATPPEAPVDLTTLDPAAVASATDECAGVVTDPGWLTACVVDRAATDDPSWLNVYRRLPPPSTCPHTPLDITHPADRLFFPSECVTKPAGTSFDCSAQAFQDTGDLLAAPVSYDSSDPSVVSVDATGRCTATQTGFAWIRASADAASAKLCVFVPGAELLISPSSCGVPPGGVVKLKALYGGANVSDLVGWTSSNPAVATVEKGLTTGVALGTVTVTATLPGVASPSATAAVRVANPTAPAPAFEATVVGTTWSDIAAKNGVVYLLGRPHVTRAEQVGGTWQLSTQVQGVGVTVAEFGAPDDTDLYWHAGDIWKAPLGGGAATSWRAESLLQGLAVDGSNVYFNSYATYAAARPSIGSVPKGGGPMTLLEAPGVQVNTPIAVDDASLYWANYQDSTLRKMPKGGGPASMLWKPNAGLWDHGLVVDDAYVYKTVTTNLLNGVGVWRIPKNGGNPERIWTTFGLVAVDDPWIYLLASNKVYRIPRTTPAPVATLRFARGAYGLAQGFEGVIRAAAYDASGNLVGGAPVAYASSDPRVATVDLTGNVTALSYGVTTLTARSGAAVATTLVAVYGGTGNGTAKLVVTGGSAAVSIGGQLALRATYTYGKTSVDMTPWVTWSASYPAKCAVSSTGVVTGVVAGAYGITASLPAPPGVSPYLFGVLVVGVRHPPEAGAVAWYTFDEGSGTTVLDSSGKGRNGTHTATYAPGRYGTALQFNGTAQATIPKTALLYWGEGNEDYTVEYWVKPTAVGGGVYRTILHKGNTDGQATSFSFFNTSNTTIFFDATTTAGLDSYYVAGPALGTWAHYAEVKQGSLRKTYVNGVLKVSRSVAWVSGNDGPLYLGKDPWHVGMIGLLDDVRVYRRALTQAEIVSDMSGNPPAP
jgi:hypothetical protein